jgi:predicted RNA binding protein YcfA (HicA-like mRNA interferase family)
MKNRCLKAFLRRRGFVPRRGKGSHAVWTHPDQPRLRVVLHGADGQDAQPYQVARACRGKRAHRGGSRHA